MSTSSNYQSSETGSTVLSEPSTKMGTDKISEMQCTLNGPISFKGVGLHTGDDVELTIEPADPGHGYVFQRTDLADMPLIPARLDKVISTNRGTTIGIDKATVSVTEHVLAALYGMGVDNVLLKVHGPEVPIMDGSSQRFVEAIDKVGVKEQNIPKDYIILKDNLYFETEEGGSEMLGVSTPGGEFRITVMVDYKSPVLGTQHASMYQLEEFKERFAKCRTFCFMKELEQLAKNNLIKGGDLDNAIVLMEKEYPLEEIHRILKMIGREELIKDLSIEGIGVLNTVKLKYENEPARHKLLDIIGDLALIGRPIKGHILAARPGHTSNVEFGKLILKTVREAENKPYFDLSQKPVYDIGDIERMLPHRYPFLLVDKVIHLGPSTITGVKNVTMNEPFFQGHFPGNPVMPGVLQLEAMAQTGGIFALSQVDEPELYTTYFMKIDKVKFKRKVIPGDTVVFDLKLLTPIRRGIVHMSGKAYVNGELASESEMLAQVVKDKG